MSNLSIEYCVSWNYYPYAAGLAEEIKQEFDFEIEFKKSHGGRFEIVLDDQLLFSKASLDRFPEDGEIVRIIKEKLKNWINELLNWCSEGVPTGEEWNIGMSALAIC